MLPAGNSFKLQNQVDVGVVLGNPDCIEAVVKQKILINRNCVLFWVRAAVRRGRGTSTRAVDLLEARGYLNRP